MKLFVYGTLKQGFGNHVLLKDSTLIGTLELPGYSMHSFGWFPVITPSQRDSVVGELYEIDEDTLARCDRLEGHPSFYQRITEHDSEHGEFYVYVQHPDEVQHLAKVEGGEW